MLRRLRDKLSYANVMATLAVALVLGGGTAAALQGQNSVQNNDVQDLSFKILTLKNGWEPYRNGLYAPAVALDDQGEVHIRGAIDQTAGTNNVAFKLPKEFRPKKDVVEPVVMLSEIGHLKINSDGNVDVVPFTLSDAQAETDLEGVTFSAG